MHLNSAAVRAVVVGVALMLLLAGCPPVKHSLTVLTTGQGSVSLSPTGGTYEKGTSVVVTATAAAGWHFDHWTGALSGSANPAQVTMDADKSVTAAFVPDQHTLTTNVTGQGTVAPAPAGGTYDAGTVVTLTATAAAGWHFDHWTGALSGSANPAQVTMDADKSVTAAFVPDQHTLTTNVTGQGTVAPAPAGGTYDAGTVVTLTATATAGWHFDHWTGALSGNANPAQVTMDADKTVTAVFVPDQHTLTTNVTGQGTIAPAPAGGTYDAGTVVTLTATAGAGWHFDHWEGALSGNANPAQVTMDADKSVTAVFAANPFALNVVVDGGGTVVLNPPGGAYEAGTVVSLSVYPSTGWHFDHWTGALSGTATFAQVTMDADKTVTAVFGREQYTLTLVATGGGSVTLDPPGGTYPFETVVTLTPNPDAGNRFEIWGGALSGVRKPITITMDSDKYVDAYFMAETFATFEPSSFCAVGSTLYFQGSGPYSGRELWKTDGTFAGTRLVRDITPLQGGTDIRFMRNLNGTLYFLGWGNAGYALWKSDGTEDGTVIVADLGDSFPIIPPVVIGENMFFSTNGTENGKLWVTDGTTAGTRIVKSWGPGTGTPFTYPGLLVDCEGVLYFHTITQPDPKIMTLWKSDGTESGTIPVYSSYEINEIAGVGGKVLFNAATETMHGALMATDGTPGGTSVLRGFDFGPGNLVVSGGLLYFGGQVDEYWLNTQIWASGGTSTFRADGFSYRPWGLVDLNGKLLYVALYDVDSVTHTGLFATTGSGGTLLHSINPTLFYSYGDYQAVVDDTLFFTAENSYGGVGLWKSDGTAGGTMMVSDITETPVGVSPYELTAMEGRLYFSAADVAHGHQVWVSDGTLAGTKPISCPTP